MSILAPHDGRPLDRARSADELDGDVLLIMQKLMGVARTGRLRNDTPIGLRADVVAYLLRHYEAVDFIGQVAREGLDAVAGRWNPGALRGLTAYPRVANAVGLVDALREHEHGADPIPGEEAPDDESHDEAPQTPAEGAP